MYDNDFFLLYNIQSTNIFITQRRTEREPILLREGVLGDAVTEKNELIHRESRIEEERLYIYI